MPFAARAPLLPALLTGLLAACGGPAPRFTDADADAIVSVLQAQRDAWNAGDIDRFMAAYEQSDALVFTSGGKIRRGYDETLARYRAKYVDGHDGGAMGELAFDDLEVRGLSPDSAVVLGRWALVDTPEAGHGVFSLVLVRQGGAWKIVHDHTSAD